MALHPDFDKELRRAIKHFWSTRKSQARKQGSKSGSRDAGSRTAVTGGRQMDGFVNLVRDHLSAVVLASTTPAKSSQPKWASLKETATLFMALSSNSGMLRAYWVSCKHTHDF
jgi:Restriction endonuclease XhoI